MDYKKIQNMLKHSSISLMLLCIVFGNSLQFFQLTSDEYNQLSGLADAPQFTLSGNVYYAKVQSIYDGDTLKAIIKFDGKYQKMDIRLNWIDTPEVSSGVVRPFGAQVREVLKKMILGKIIRLQAAQFDKYGRLLGAIQAYTAAGELVNINAYLAEHGMAKYYYGGTKEQFTQTDYDYFINTFRNTTWPTFVNYPLQQTA